MYLFSVKFFPHSDCCIIPNRVLCYSEGPCWLSIFFLNIYFWLCSAFFVACAFSSCSSKWELRSSCGVWASQWGDFSFLRTWAPGTRASVVLASVLSSCGTWASSPHSTRNLPRPGIEPVSPALAAGFLSSGPPGKPDAELRTMMTGISQGYPCFSENVSLQS